mgnify:CR=1 FL=1
MIHILQNPKTETYQQLKTFILSRDFTWFWHDISTIGYVEDGHDNVPFYCHTFLERPEQTKSLYPLVKSQLIESASNVFQEILNYNKVNHNVFLRMSVNCVEPLSKQLKTVPHNDHEIVGHSNILIYLNNSDGDTIVEKQISKFKENKSILFQGEHYHITPSKKRRIVMVATFI